MRYSNVPKWVVLALGFSVCLPLSAAERIPVERRLPQDVQTLVVLGSVPKFRTQLDSSLFGRMLADPQMPTWPARNFKEISKIVEGRAGVGITQLLDASKGELAFANVIVDDTPAMVLLVDLGSETAQAHHFVKIVSAWITLMTPGKQAAVANEVICGTSCSFYVLPKEFSTELLNGRITPGYCRRGTYFLAASSRKALTAVLERWDGRHPQTLENAKVYSSIRKNIRFPKVPQEEMLDGFRFYSGAVTATYPGLWPEAQLFLGSFGFNQASMSLHGLGLPDSQANEIVGIAGVVLLGSDGKDVLCRTVVVPSETHVRDLDERVSLQPLGKTGATPNWIRSDVNHYWVWRWNKQFTSNLAMAPTIQELDIPLIAGVRELDKRIAAKGVSVFGLSTGLARQVTFPITRPEDPQVNAVLALELSGANAESNLRKALDGQTVHEDKIGSLVVWRVNPDPLPFGEEQKANPAETVFVTVTRQQLLVASNFQSLKQIVEPNQNVPALAETPDFKATMQETPQPVLARRFNRISPALVRGLLCDGEPEFNGEAGQPKAVAVSEALNKYFPPLGGYVERTEDGSLRSTVFRLRAGK